MRKGITNNLYFCNVSILDRDYQHTIDFSNKTNQLNYFVNKRVYTVTGNYIIDSLRSAYTINKPIEEVGNVDYLYLIKDSKYYFYFITGIEYYTASTTIIYVELDVFQTYLFDMQLKPSFVDRCHVPRWTTDGKPIINTVSEDLQRGDFTILDKIEVYNYRKDGGYIITSTEPLGVIQGGRRADNIKYTGIGGHSSIEFNKNDGNWRLGMVSSRGFRFTKGYEGFGPYSYKDSAGNLTVGYGVTLHGEPTYYRMLAAKNPCSEEEAAKISYSLKCNNYGKKILQRCIQLGVTKQYQFDALVDLAFNGGNGVILNDNKLTQVIKQDINNEKAIRDVWENFYVSDGVNVLAGLKARRKAECDIFFNGKYEYRDIVTLDKNGNINGVVKENEGNGWLPKDTGSEDSDYNGTTISNKFGIGAIPTHGIVTACYPFYPSGSRHTGVDIANNEGTPIYSWKSGKVISIGQGYGLGIVIDHDDMKSRAIYGHNSKVLVNVGDHVKEGQQIALMGSTGNSTGNHLHFEIRPWGGPYGSDVNPWDGLKIGQKV